MMTMVMLKPIPYLVTYISYMGLSKEAQKCYLVMLKKAIKISDNYLIASAYLSLGEIYKDKKSFDEVIIIL